MAQNPELNELRTMRKQLEQKRLAAIESLLKQREEIDKQLAELEYVDIERPAENPGATQVPAKRLRSEQTRLRMSAQYWIRHRANKEGLKAALEKTPGLKKMMDQLQKEGSTGYSPRNTVMARKQGQ